MNTYAFMDQNLAVIVFLQILTTDVGLVESAAENIQGKKHFAEFRMLQIEKDLRKPFVEDSRVLAKRGAVRSAALKWTTSTDDGKPVVRIPFVVDNGLDSKAESELKRAIQDLQAATCVRFLPRTIQEDYVSFEPGSTCSSPIGKREGKEIVFVGQGCENKGAILHELVYLLGFYDEHNRADRDDYIQIFEENIAQGWKEEVMRIYQPGFMDNLGFDYDLHSIMQYKNTAFAKRAGLVTMQARSDPNMELGNQNAMSAADIMKINKLYQCSGSGDLYKNMEVTVQTGNGFLDGTNAFLYLELIGEGDKRSGESNVAKGGYHDDFESGKTGRYLVAFKDVGPIRKLKVRLQENPSGSYFDGWTFSKIIIRDDGQTYTFDGRDLSIGHSVTVNAS